MERLVAIDTAAEMLGVSIFTVRRYIRLGSIPAVYVGARLMVNEREVEKVQTQGLKKIPMPKKEATADDPAPDPKKAKAKKGKRKRAK